MKEDSQNKKDAFISSEWKMEQVLKWGEVINAKLDCKIFLSHALILRLNIKMVNFI